jgi:ABC-type ATPase involved in cell division
MVVVFPAPLCPNCVVELPVNIDMVSRHVNRYLLGHSGAGKAITMSMLTGNCSDTTVQETRLPCLC